MIFAFGLPNEGTFAQFLRQAENDKFMVTAFDISQIPFCGWIFPMDGIQKARVWSAKEEIQLDPRDSYFCRIINLARITSNAEDGAKINAFNAGLTGWLDLVPGIVINRSQAGRHNGSKPLHESILRDLGFSVPPSLTTCDLSEIRAFLRAGPAISKTICGVRAEAVEVSERDFDEFEPPSGPVHLQRLITGYDVRVHVIGNLYVAQEIKTIAVDYRSVDEMHKLEVFELDSNFAKRLVVASKSLGLELSGWDFKVDALGRFWCLEVNPMPGYGIYDKHCDGKISRCLLDHLSGKG
jgi:hypothetical protein